MKILVFKSRVLALDSLETSTALASSTEVSIPLRCRTIFTCYLDPTGDAPGATGETFWTTHPCNATYGANRKRM